MTRILQDELKLLLRRGALEKGCRGFRFLRMGSFQSAANPVLRDTTERVVIASKGRFDRALSRKRAKRGLPHHNTISKEEFMAATLDVWDINPESAKRVGHPALLSGRLAQAPHRALHVPRRRGP